MATSIRGNAEFSYISVGIGMVLGLALGAIPLPIPGLGTLSLGVAAGPLIVALILGWLGRTGPIGWRIPAPANLVLRNLGLTLFLAAVAIGAGRPFVTTVATTGIPILLAGAAVLLTNVLIVLLVGYYVMKLPYNSLDRCGFRHDGESGDSGVCVPPAAVRAGGYRLCHDLSVHDDCEGGRGASGNSALRRRSRLTEALNRSRIRGDEHALAFAPAAL